jgi:hypothetical protein
VESSLFAFDVLVDRSDPTLTSFAGLPLVLETWHALGLPEACAKHLRVKQRNRGLSVAEWVEMLVALRVAGGKRPADLEALKQDPGLCRLWGLPKRASPRSVYQFLERFHDFSLPPAQQGKAIIFPESPGLRGLAEVNRVFLQRLRKLHPVEVATLDLDASIQESTKDAALWTYEKVRGYQPVAVQWVEQGVVVCDEFRDGNVPAAMGQLEVVERAFAMLPGDIRTRYFRADSASYDHRLMRWLDREGIGFAITADMSRSLKSEIAKLEESQWNPLFKQLEPGLRIKTEKQYAEVAFVPDDPTAGKGERPFRYIALRVPGQIGLPFDTETPSSGWKYFAVCTNRWDLGPAQEQLP